jgi:CDP-glucose 4,6-dehydratase
LEKQPGKMENLVNGQSLLAYYKGKRIFLTGHTGFKGSWLLKILSMAGGIIKGYALAPQSIDYLYIALSGEKLCESIIADIRDKQKLEEEILSFQPDIIFHLAAQPLVRFSYEIPLETFEVNTLGTANILDAIRKLKKECQVVLVTTDKVYHNNETKYAYKEEDRLGGYDPYSASKAAAEIIIDSYRNSFFNINNYEEHKKGIAVARAGNVIGGGDWSKDRLVPDIINALSKNKPVKVRNPLSVRPWQHVVEPLFGYLLLAKKNAETPTRYAQAYNFGPNNNDTLSVENLIEVAIQTWGNGIYENSVLKNQPHEAGLLTLDISKAKKELGWHPLMNSNIAIQKTVLWYKHFINGQNAVELVNNDIEFYLSLLNNN